MSLTVIVAASMEQARAVAKAHRIRNWIYPGNPEVLRGVIVDRIVWVDGWQTSALIRTPAMQMLAARSSGEVEEQRAMVLGLEAFGRAEAWAELDRQRALRKMSSPFVAPVGAQAAPKRRWWQR